MKKTIFSKIFTSYVIIVVAAAGVILLIAITAVRAFHKETLRRDLEKLGRTLATKAAPMVEEKRYDDLDKLAKELGGVISTRITVIDPGGKVLADSEENPDEMDDHSTRPEVARALEGAVGESVRFSKTVERDMMYVAVPLESKGKTVAVVRTSLFVEDINSLLGRLTYEIAGVVGIVLVVVLIIAYLVARGMSKPVRELCAASRRIGGGDFDVRVFIKNNDELKDLAASFNTMTERIKTQFDEISQRREELNSLIGSIQEGFIVIDTEGRITLANASFATITGIGDAEGKCYWQVVRSEEFVDFVGSVMEGRKSATQQIDLNGRTVLASATFLATRGETAVIMYDLSLEENVQRIKKDFVTNVSHELRTPLTAIKGFLETLEESSSEENKRYVGIIQKHTERLIRIVEDLLTLSELESKGEKLQLEDVEVNRLITDILGMFESKVKEKNLTVTLDVDEELPAVSADAFKLEQVFVNLIDNAITYTEKGGITITSRIAGDRAEIAVRDTGIGIEPEHLSRIFERFYVVNKARSRRYGGTGLGLAIVKHILLLHGGNVAVESTPGAGTTFTVTLPLRHS